MSIFFVTTNMHKLRAAQRVMPEIQGLNKELTEIQDQDSHHIVAKKLQQAADFFSFPVIVEDSSLHIVSLGGLPGPFIKWFLHSLRPAGLADLVHRYPDHRATASVLIGYLENKNATPCYFRGEKDGQIVAPRGQGGFGYDVVFQPDGSEYTLGELKGTDYDRMSPRNVAFLKLRDYLTTHTPDEKTNVY